jgi:hypothetical protein
MMNIDVRIERLILEGLPVERGQGPVVQAAVEAELARLLGERGLAESLQGMGAIPGLRADAIQLTPAGSPAEIGTQIAQAVYGGIGNPK